MYSCMYLKENLSQIQQGIPIYSSSLRWGAQYFILSYWRGQSGPTSGGGSYSILKFAVVLQYIPGPVVSQASAINSHSLSLPASLPHCCDPIPPLAPAVSWTDAPGHTCNGGHECSHLSKGYNIHPGILNMDAPNDGFYFWKISTYFGYLLSFRRKIH